MRRIAVVGAGGINSWVVAHLAEIRQTFFSEEKLYVKIFDADIVEEKNLLRQTQNYTVENLMENKAEVLAKRYYFDFANVYITEQNIEELSSFDEVILGVDNHKTRKLVYEYCINKGTYCLDLRAQGTRLSYFALYPVSADKKAEVIEKYNNKFFSNPEVLERKGSCQLQKDIEQDHIENANKAIAFVGVNCIFLKRLRDEELTTNEFEFVY